MQKKLTRQTITTKFLPQTNHKPSRVKATHRGNVLSVTISEDSVPDGIDPHAEAARLLKEKLGWKGEMVGGSIKAGPHSDGLVFVFVEGSVTI